MVNNPQRVQVNRITIDEKLAENLFRFQICRLKKGIKLFIDRFGTWTEEKEKFVKPKNYYRTFKIKKDLAPSWESLVEGQVFLSGEFKIVGNPEDPKYFTINPGNKHSKETYQNS